MVSAGRGCPRKNVLGWPDGGHRTDVRTRHRSTVKNGATARRFMTGSRGMPAIGRRAFLAGAASTAVLGQPVGRASSTALFGPRATLEIDGAKEVVVGDDGRVAYVATTDGFATVDVTEPTAPSLLAEIDHVSADALGGRLRRVWDVHVDGDRLVIGGPAIPIGDASGSGFVVYDVSDPTEPRQVGAAGTRDGIHNAFIQGDVVYLAGSTSQAVSIYDVEEDPPTEIGSFSPADHGEWQPRTIHDVYVAGDTMYACFWDLGTWVVDVSDPAAPEARLRVGFDQEARPDTARAELPGNAHYAQPDPEQEVLAVGKEAGDHPETEIVGPPGGVELWDLSDPSNPSREHVISAPPETADQATGTAHNLGWAGDRLYVSWNDGGVEVYEVPAADEPVRLAGWRDAERARFWTAKPIHDGFVATATRPPFDDDGPQPGLFTFPEPAGDDPAPARAMEPLAPADSTLFFEPTPVTAASPEPTTDASGTTSPSPAGGAEGGPSRTGIPGLDAAVALAGGGLAGWWLLRRRRAD